MPDVGFKSFAHQRETSGLEFPPDCGLLYWGWSLWQDCVPASADSEVGLFPLTYSLRVTQAAFSLGPPLPPEEVVPYLAADSLCQWEEVSLESPIYF